jgi:hypothetical protein
VRDATEAEYKVVNRNVTLEGFKCNTDKPILTPENLLPGTWAAALRKGKANRGIPDAQ